MRYGDLFRYEPLRTVVELRKSGSMDRELVSTYVVSDEMADKLASVVIPNLRFDIPGDNKGVLVVGNYGTGKSHLMSVIASVAEHAPLAGEIGHPGTREAVAPIAGRFKVVRVELNTTAPLRDVLCRELERALEGWGISFAFPPQDRLTNNKEPLEEMMAAFEAAFPGQGILLVVDELLDYLRGRMSQGNAIVLDFGFLRELGEIGSDLPFRFVGGVQVSLFDNPEFQFVADAIRRVQARFAQVVIGKRDVQFVVSERLLRKTVDQQARIRQHLLPYARFYEGMNERMDEYVRLFPVHPDYIGVFERITVAEKREVLRTISRAMERLKEEPVPADAPGLLAFDSYWEEIRGNAALRTQPEIRTVLDASGALEELVEKGYPRGKNLGMARRVVHGLSVHRLSVGNIETPVGMAAEQLRDHLCLYDPLVAELGGEAAEDLRGEVETTLRLISRTVNGQFISATERDARGGLGGQFYLDVRKTVDYDAQVERRAATLGRDVLDRRYFEALTIALQRKEVPTVATGHMIWEHDVTWAERNASRRGYLVLGAPNDRSTAQPPRDFYLYFLQPFLPPPHDQGREDELFFDLTGADDSFRMALERYAAAMDLASTSAGNEKMTYQRKAEQYLAQISRWLGERMLDAFDVTYRGTTRKIPEWVRGTVRTRLGLGPADIASVRDILDLVAATCLAGAFEKEAREYPTFSHIFTAETRPQAAQDALRGIRSGQPTKQATAVLDALELLDGDRLDVGRSRYARHILERRRQKGEGQVLNRAELVEYVNGEDYMAPGLYRLELEWVVVLLGALVYNGDLELALPGRRFDAGDMDALAATPVAELAAFKHLAPPREMNVAVLRTVFELLGESPGLANQVAQGDRDTARLLHTRVTRRVQELVRAQQQVQSGLPFWGRALLSDAEQAAFRAELDGAKRFLESLQPYDTPGKLKNLPVTGEQVRAHAGGVARAEEVAALQQLTHDLSPLATYLAQAAMALPTDHPWVSAARVAERELTNQLASPEVRAKPQFRAQALQRLESLRREYVRAYSALHARARLGQAESGRRAALLNDERLRRLDAVAPLPVLSRGRLDALRTELSRLRECGVLTEQQLHASPVCPSCAYTPAAEPAGPPPEAVIRDTDAALDELLESWTRTLLDALDDEATRAKLDLVTPAHRAELDAFAASRRIPDAPERRFVPAMKEVLGELIRVVIDFDALKAALGDGGAVARPDELRARFDSHLNRLIRGNDSQRVRLVVE